MALPSTQVKFRLFNATGLAAVGLHVSAALTRPDTDAGAVVPSRVVRGTSDASGECTLSLWPNARGTTGSQYAVVISRNGLTEDGYTITVPESLSTVLVESIKSAPPYPAVSAAQAALEAAQQAVVDAANASRLTIGTVTTGEPAATITGDAGAQQLNLVLPAAGEGGTAEPAGPAGAAGADGADGLSAYELAVAAGFVGTEAAWLASLVGPAGPAGADGADGAQGPAGPAGADALPADIAAIVNAAASKATPVDADGVAGIDSEDGFSLIKFTWANIKATLKTYFDTLYAAASALTSHTGSTSNPHSVTAAQAGAIPTGGLKTVNGNGLEGSGDIAVSATPGGSTTQVQFNDGGAFAGHAGMTFDKTNGILSGTGDFGAVKTTGLSVIDTANFCAIFAYRHTGLINSWGGYHFCNQAFGSANAGNMDLSLVRDAPNTLAQRLGTAAQTARIYNTYTSLSNRENFAISWASNICTIGTEAVGATQRPLIIDGSTVSIAAPLYVKQYTTATRPAWVNGAQIFDTDLDKLLIGGVSGWEVVTSI